MTKLFLVQGHHWDVPGRRQKIVAHAAAADQAAIDMVAELWADHAEDGGDAFEVTDWRAGLMALCRARLVEMGDAETVDGITDAEIESAYDQPDSGLPNVWIDEVDADLSPAPRPNPVAVICPRCGSDNVTSDAAARWSIEAQDWELSSAHDSETCNACDYEGDHMGKRVPVDQAPPKPEHNEQRDIPGLGVRYWHGLYEFWAAEINEPLDDANA